MAGSYEMYKALFRQAGVVEVDDLIELFDAAKALAVYTPAKIEKVLVVSSSGGRPNTLCIREVPQAYCGGELRRVSTDQGA